MNRRRELTLQRVSRIGSLASTGGAVSHMRQLTIEAALGAYMMKNRWPQEYLPTPEESQLAKPGLENKPKIKIVLAEIPSTQKNNDEDGQTAFDRLDANRCSGFLLYSYNKKGVHSVLGEHITPGSRSIKDENRRGNLWIQSV